MGLTIGSGSEPDPLGPVGAGLFLPDRRALLQLVDELLRGGERLAAVGRAGGERDRDVADLERAGAMLEREPRPRIARLDLVADRVEDLLGHRGVGLVLELLDGAP